LKTVLAPGFKARALGVAGWYSTNILGNRDGEVLDDPQALKSKEESKMAALKAILDPELFPDLYGDLIHRVRIDYYPPRGDNKEAWDNIDLVGWLGYPMQIKINFLCRDSILAAPLALDLVLLADLGARAGAVVPLDEEDALPVAQLQAETLGGLREAVGVLGDEVDLGRPVAVGEGGQGQEVDSGVLQGAQDAGPLAGLVRDVDVLVVGAADLVGHGGPPYIDVSTWVGC